MSEALWPYLVVVLAGFVPNEVFRVAAVFLARGIDERSEVFAWIRTVALALLAAVVSKLLFQPPAVLAAVPLLARWAAVGTGVAAFFALRRSLLGGILAGEALLVAAAWLSAIPAGG